MVQITEIATDLKFPEGPIAMPDGSILLVEIAAGTLTRISSEGKKETVTRAWRRAKRRCNWSRWEMLYL